MTNKRQRKKNYKKAFERWLKWQVEMIFKPSPIFIALKKREKGTRL